MFPGIDPNAIEEAIKNRENNVKPSLPQVRSTSMDLEGRFSILFDEYILLPEKMDQKYWDALLEIKVLSN
jgi:hypothetical protein